jgi:hypothetical protein
MKGETLSASADNRASNATKTQQEISMVLYASEFDQSRYLKAADIGEVGSEKRVKIKVVTKETDVGEKQETKACVWFTNLEKGLLLNKTNLRTLQGAFGDAMDAWASKIAVLYVIMDNYHGKMIPSLRVRIPPPKEAHKAPVSPLKPTPKPPADEDDGFDDPEPLDDHISDVA